MHKDTVFHLNWKKDFIMRNMLKTETTLIVMQVVKKRKAKDHQHFKILLMKDCIRIQYFFFFFVTLTFLKFSPKYECTLY